MARTSAATENSQTATAVDRSERRKEVIAASVGPLQGRKFGGAFLSFSRVRVQSRDAVMNRCHACTMPSQSLFVVALVGLLAGLVARWLLGRRSSTFAGLGLGLAGAAAGAAVAAALGLPVEHLPPFVAAAICGATGLLALARPRLPPLSGTAGLPPGLGSQEQGLEEAISHGRR